MECHNLCSWCSFDVLHSYFRIHCLLSVSIVRGGSSLNTSHCMCSIEFSISYPEILQTLFGIHFYHFVHPLQSTYSSGSSLKYSYSVMYNELMIYFIMLNHIGWFSDSNAPTQYHLDWIAALTEWVSFRKHWIILCIPISEYLVLALICILVCILALAFQM